MHDESEDSNQAPWKPAPAAPTQDEIDAKQMTERNATAKAKAEEARLRQQKRHDQSRDKREDERTRKMTPQDGRSHSAPRERPQRERKRPVRLLYAETKQDADAHLFEILWKLNGEHFQDVATCLLAAGFTGPIPNNFHEAVNGEHGPQWMEATA